MSSQRFVLAAVVVVAFLPAPAAAQVQITQAKAIAGNVTPGDAAGFPITISRPGSYILKGNLTVPNENTHGILITTSHVTIDLNGFAILGPTDCSSGFEPCAREGTGNGITTAGLVQFNITIRNGTIQGMGFSGVSLNGDSHLIERLHVRSNGANGIGIFQSNDRGGSIIQHNTVQRNGSTGILLDRGVITNNIVNVNRRGIFGGLGPIMVSHNVVTRNVFTMSLSAESGYFANNFSDNQAPSGGQNLGQNICDTGACP